MPRVEVGDHSFQYMEEGEISPTILLLCSTGLDSKQWKGLLPHLGGRRELCPHYLCYPGTVDWTGAGEIDSLMDYRAAEALLLAEDGPVDIIGHSYGGFIALRLAKEHPDRIRRMAFHEPIVWGACSTPSVTI